MSNESDLDNAAKAGSVLNAPAFQDAYKAVRDALIDGIEKCPTKDVETAEDFRRCLKLLSAVRLNLETALKSGRLAEFRLEQARKEQSNPFRTLKGVFRGSHE